MSQSSMKRPTRRAILEKAVALTGVMPLMPRLVQGVAGFFLVAPTEPAAAAAREEWGWKPDYDIDRMVDEMLEKMSAKLRPER